VRKQGNNNPGHLKKSRPPHRTVLCSEDAKVLQRRCCAALGQVERLSPAAFSWTVWAPKKRMFNAVSLIQKAGSARRSKERAGQARPVRLRWVFWACHNVM